MFLKTAVTMFPVNFLVFFFMLLALLRGGAYSSKYGIYQPPVSLRASFVCFIVGLRWNSFKTVKFTLLILKPNRFRTFQGFNTLDYM